MAVNSAGPQNHFRASRSVWHHFSTVSCIRESGPGLSTHRQTDVSDVVAVVKSSKGNRMFTNAGNRKIQSITLALAVGNPVVRKHLVSGTAIDAYIGSLNAAGGVLDLKIYSNAIRGDLGSGQSPHYRRG